MTPPPHCIVEYIEMVFMYSSTVCRALTSVKSKCHRTGIPNLSTYGQSRRRTMQGIVQQLKVGADERVGRQCRQLLPFSTEAKLESPVLGVAGAKDH